MVEMIKKKIQAVLPDALIYVFNINDDGEHFEAIVIDASFEGKSLVQQQKIVMSAMKEAFETKVHAMALKTFSPSKWELKKHLYNI